MPRRTSKSDKWELMVERPIFNRDSAADKPPHSTMATNILSRRKSTS